MFLFIFLIKYKILKIEINKYKAKTNYILYIIKLKVKSNPIIQ